MLSDNADKVEEVGYMKAFTPDEMETMKDRLSKIVIDINDIDEEKKAANDEFKLRKKPLETEKQEASCQHQKQVRVCGRGLLQVL